MSRTHLNGVEAHAMTLDPMQRFGWFEVIVLIDHVLNYYKALPNESEITEVRAKYRYATQAG